MNTATEEIPLFPLKTVLFPGGVLPLRIFEPRYLDMVSACLRNDSGFGVVAIREGEAVAQQANIHAVGTLARMVDFDRLDDGLLGIRCLGVRRFRVMSHRLQHDQLLVGQVAWLAEDRLLAPQPSHQPLRHTLQMLLENEALQSYARFLAPDWENAAWIGNRLTEILPLSLSIRQTLLEMNEPQERLDLLLAILQEHRIL